MSRKDKKRGEALINIVLYVTRAYMSFSAKKLLQPSVLAALLGVALVVAVIAFYLRKMKENSTTTDSTSTVAETESPPILTGAIAQACPLTPQIPHMADNKWLTPFETASGKSSASTNPTIISSPYPLPLNSPVRNENGPVSNWMRGGDRPFYSPEDQRIVDAFNTEVTNVDQRIFQQWALYEKQFQQNIDTPLSKNNDHDGKVWLQNWESWGPYKPFLSNTIDPQLIYASSLMSAMDAQEEKFALSSQNPNSYQNKVHNRYLNQLQQLPGSFYVVEENSFDPYKTPQVIDRFSHLSQMAAKWLVAKLNEEMKIKHPCFSKYGREHFEYTNPPEICNQENPISLIRVFECRVKYTKDGDSQIFITLEIGNSITAGSGGMYSAVITMNNKGRFVDYKDYGRDQKQTFVLPRSRT